MPRISIIRADILRVVAEASGAITATEIVEGLGGKYTRDQVGDALKWLVPDGMLMAEKEKWSHDNKYFIPTRLQPSPEIEFDRQTRSLSHKLDLDLTGPIGWQFQLNTMIRGWQANDSGHSQFACMAS